MEAINLTPDSVSDPEVARLVRRYKRSVASRYRLLSTKESDALPDGTLLVSPKIDGELWYLVRTESGCMLVSHNGRSIAGGDLLQEAEHTFMQHASHDAIFAGELYAIGAGDRPRVGDVSSALRKGDMSRLRFKAFDIVRGWSTRSYPHKLEIIRQVLEDGERITAIDTWEARKSDVVDLISEHVSSGKNEGLVVRSKSGLIFKMKPSFTTDCLVMGYTKRAGAEQVSSILLGLAREDGTTQVVGHVGNLGTEEDRRSLLSKLEPLHVDSRYRSADRQGAMYRMVKPAMVVEVRCTDLQPDVQQWALAYSQGWDSVTRVEGAAMLHPSLVRIRCDKTTDREDIRVEQLLDRCRVKAKAAITLALPLSTPMGRLVYTKEVRGHLCVKKIVWWKTNKAAAHGFPEYVVHFTDFSPSRKKPMARTVRLAQTSEAAEEIVEALIASNIKRGWEAICDSAAVTA